MRKKGTHQHHEWSVSLPISIQSVEMLEELVDHGIYGRCSEEVAARFIDEKLREFFVQPEIEPPLQDP